MKKIFLFLNLLIINYGVLFAQEEITITTYYPSPYGSYNQLQTNTLGVGDNDNDGGLDSGDVPTTAGDVWIKGNVGIGTTSPGDKLEVKGGNLYINGTGMRQAELKIKADSQQPAWRTRVLLDRVDDYRGAGLWIDSSAGSELDWYAGVPYEGAGFTIGYHGTQPEYTANSKLFINTSGNVGIGTASPDGQLSLYKSTSGGTVVGSILSITGLADIGDYNGIRFGFSPTSGYNKGAIFFERTASFAKGSIHFATDDTSDTSNADLSDSRMTITRAGNVGIGTTGPNKPLEVVDTIRASRSGTPATYLEMFGGSGSQDPYLNWAGTATNFGVRFNGGSNLLEVLNNGNVGIGTTSPGGKLDVNGTIYQRGTVLHADYVFEPDYKLESIEDHSAYMWREKHLKAVPKAQKDGEGQDVVEIGALNRGTLEELEKAHVYIQQLNGRIKVLEMKLSKLEVK